MNYWAIGAQEYESGGQIIDTILEYGGIPTGETRPEYFEQVGVQFSADKNTDLDGLNYELTENCLYLIDEDGNLIERKEQ